MADSNFLQQIQQRRTFAIISHPDAGKTTITEKLLLHGQLIQKAGTVKGRGSDRHATSDWMAMEKQRGISVTTSVMHMGNIAHRVGNQKLRFDAKAEKFIGNEAANRLAKRQNVNEFSVTEPV